MVSHQATVDGRRTDAVEIPLTTKGRRGLTGALRVARRHIDEMQQREREVLGITRDDIRRLESEARHLINQDGSTIELREELIDAIDFGLARAEGDPDEMKVEAMKILEGELDAARGYIG